MDAVRARKLLDMAFSYIGMIDEVKTKCLLLKNRVQSVERHEGTDERFEEEVRSSLRQMRSDLAKYHRKLRKIYQELHKHGFIPNME